MNRDDAWVTGDPSASRAGVLAASITVLACGQSPGAAAAAARAVLVIVSAPIGTALCGPLVVALGARDTLLASALTTIGLALIAAAVIAVTASPPTTRTPTIRADRS